LARPYHQKGVPVGAKNTMRNLQCEVTNTRRKVFCEVAKFAYEKKPVEALEQIPFEIVDCTPDTMRETVFLERAIVAERIRLAMGLPLRDMSENKLITENVEESSVAERYYEPPLVNVIKFACNACADTHYEISDACVGCISRHCVVNCAKKAISIEHGKAHINQDLCVKCGKCKSACSFHAIIKFRKPCETACGVGAIEKDEHGRTVINYDKCVSCGQCMVNCPFGAIADKSQLYQLIHSINNGDKLIAIFAPSFWGQFGDNVRPVQVYKALKMLGFSSIREVASGADLCAIAEAKEFMEKVPEEQPFMATSCCPAWSLMAKRDFPDIADNISMTLTPMVFTARLVKKNYPDARVVFIGPCVAKKLEASRRQVRSHVDFVITYEELQGMLDAKGIVISDIEDSQADYVSSADAIGFAHAGGVAEAVKNVIDRLEPGREVKMTAADGLADCRKMLTLAKAGKYNGFLLEGMACPGGCIAGAGTIQPSDKARRILDKQKANAILENPLDSGFIDLLDTLLEERESYKKELEE